MRHIAHASALNDVAGEQRRFGELLRHDFYDGQFTFDLGSSFSVKLEQGLLQPARVMLLGLRHARFTFFRSPRHVRDGHQDFDVLWFINRGALAVSQAGRSCVVKAGQAVINSSRSPVRISQELDAMGCFESLIVVVPRRFTRSIGHQDFAPALPVMLKHGHGRLAERSFYQLLDLGEELSGKVTNSMVMTCVEAVLASQEDIHSIDHDEMRVTPALTAGNRMPALIGNPDDPSALIHWIEDNLDQKFTVGALADAAGLSIPQLSRYFKRVFGLGPWEYVISRRLKRASELLRHGDSAASVADRCGFCDQAHFTKLFKKKFGVPPREFARRAKLLGPVL